MGLATMFQSMNESYNQSSIKPIVDSVRATTYFLFKKGKLATWIFGVTLIMIGFPLILAIEREQQVIEMEKQQMGQGFGGQPPQMGMTPSIR